MLEFQQHMISKKLKISYINQTLALLNQLFNYGIKFFDLTKNPAKIVDKLKNKEPKKLDNFITIDEFSNTMGNENNPTYYALFYTLFFSSLRIGEALALQVKDINFNFNRIL